MGTFTNFPYGVTSFGIPVVGQGPISIPSPNGRAIFVDGVNGSGVADGTVSNPYATISLAITVAQPGDTIYVFPGSYDENVSVDVDYLTIAGAQFAGYARPDITPATGVALFVAAQGFMAKHCRFASADSDVVQQVGNGFLYEDCVFDGSAGQAGTETNFRFLPSSTNDAFTASEGVVANCLIRGCNGIAMIFDDGAAPVGVGSTDNLITGCKFTQNAGVDIATADSGTPGAVYSVKNVLIAGNYFTDKNKATYLDFTTSNGGAASDQSGCVAGNYFATDTMTTTKIKAVGTAFTFPGNYDNVGIFDGSGLD